MRMSLSEVEKSQRMNFKFNLKTIRIDIEGRELLKVGNGQSGIVSFYELKKTENHGIIKYPCLSIASDWQNKEPDQI